jgi:omega-hydroxypalmitate O-feruloyl transferase
MSAWASNSAFKQNQNIMDDEVQPKPVVVVHDRDTLLMMMAENYSSEDDDQGVITCRPAAAIHHLYQLIMQSAATDHVLMIKTSDYVHKTFHLSGAFINSLKKQLVGDHFSCSSFELVAAHLWKV